MAPLSSGYQTLFFQKIGQRHLVVVYSKECPPLAYTVFLSLVLRVRTISYIFTVVISNKNKQALKKRYERFKRSILLVPRWRNLDFYKFCLEFAVNNYLVN